MPKQFVEIKGISYLLGTAGSLILICPQCGAEHFRDADDYFRNPDWYTCFLGHGLMEPVKSTDLDKWATKFNWKEQSR